MGRLYVVSTPIGNLEDITLRAIHILKEVDLIAAEDTRHTKKLLNRYGIKKPLTSYFEHNELTKGEFIISYIKNGKDVALVSDAGTPGISDPGCRLIKMAIGNSIEVVPVPGVSAVISAVSVSGLPTDRFTFEGFLPKKEKEAERLFLKIISEKRTSVFYESPKRLMKTLGLMQRIFGNTDIVIAREISKMHEEFIRGRINDIYEMLKQRTIKGEITIIVPPSSSQDKEERSLDDEIRYYYKELGLSLKEAANLIAKDRGMQKRLVYKQGLKIKEED